MTDGTSEYLRQLILESQLVPPLQLEEAETLRRERGGNLCSILVAQGYLSEERLLAWLGSLPGISSIDIQHYAIDPALRQYVPAPYAAAHELMPLDRLRKNLTVAMAVPLDEETTTELHDLTELTIRAVLCSCSDIHAAIEQYYTGPDAPATWPWHAKSTQRTLRPAAAADGAVVPGPEAVRLGGVVAILNAVDRFPLLPEVHSRILDRVADPDVSVAELSELIERDATVTANVLKLANSAAFAARNRFNGVQRAVAYLGLRELHGLILSSAVVHRMTAEAQCDLTELLDAAYRRGMLTKIICTAGELGDHDTAFTTGLLADLGVIALRIFCSDRLDEITAAAPMPGPDRAKAEEATLGMTASEVGYHLAQRWNIPDPIAEAIRFHDRLDLTDAPSTITVAAALAKCCLARDAAAGAFGDPATDEQLTDLLARLNLSADALVRIETRYGAAQYALTTAD